VSHSAFTPHPIQGWTPDFIPYVLQESVDKRYYDELIPIAGPDAIAWSRRLAAEEGIFTGSPAGLARGRRSGRRSAHPKARSSAACCPTPASAICRRRCSRASRPT
jgi:hypothetical protein